MKHIIIPALLFLSFYLGVYNNRLAIWDTESKTPTVILPYNIDCYPETDRQRLHDGIPFANQSELNVLLQDFIS